MKISNGYIISTTVGGIGIVLSIYAIVQNHTKIKQLKQELEDEIALHQDDIEEYEHVIENMKGQVHHFKDEAAAAKAELHRAFEEDIDQDGNVIVNPELEDMRRRYDAGQMREQEKAFEEKYGTTTEQPVVEVEPVDVFPKPTIVHPDNVDLSNLSPSERIRKRRELEREAEELEEAKQDFPN